MPRWQNQSRLFGCRPTRILTPQSSTAVGTVVAEAAAAQSPVRMVGAGTVQGDVAVSSGVLLRADALTDLQWVEADVVRVGAGVSLAKLEADLHRSGRAIAGLAGPSDATVAGTVSTSGYGFRVPLNCAVRALELVTADGDVRWYSADTDIARAAMGGIGAFGIITALELHTVPAYWNNVTSTTLTFDDAAQNWRDWVQDSAWLQWWWVPGSQRVLVWRAGPAVANMPPTAAALPTPTEPRWRRRVGLAVPLLLPRLNRTAVLGAAADLAAPWSAGVRGPDARAVSTTWTVPLDQALPALRILRESLRGAAQTTTTALIVRALDADTGLLSPFRDRRSALISARVHLPAPFERYFRAVADALAPFDARPHLASYLPQTPASPLAGHPGVAAARELRAALDPSGLFDSAAVARLLGS